MRITHQQLLGIRIPSLLPFVKKNPPSCCINGIPTNEGFFRVKIKVYLTSKHCANTYHEMPWLTCTFHLSHAYTQFRACVESYRDTQSITLGSIRRRTGLNISVSRAIHSKERFSYSSRFAPMLFPLDNYTCL